MYLCIIKIIIFIILIESQDYLKPIDATLWAHLMINESKNTPKFLNNYFKVVASTYLLERYNITVEDISHTNLRLFYVSLVRYIESLMA